MRVLSVLAIFLALAGLALSHESSADSKVVSLTSANFDENVKDSGKPFMVMFYAPWCQHCKHLLPIWDEASTNYETVGWGKVDCTVEQDMCSSYNVQGYPTVKLFLEGAAIDYNGERSGEAFFQFVERMKRPALSEFSTLDELNEFIKANPTAFVFFGEAPLKAVISSAAKTFQAETDFATIAGSEAASAFNLPYPALVAFAADDIYTFEGDFERYRVENWIRKTRHGLVPELGPQNYGELSNMGLPLVIHAVDPEAEDFAATLESTKQVAKKFGDKFVFAWLNGVQWAQFLQGAFQLSADQVPVVAILDTSAKVFYTHKVASTEEFGAFLDSVASGAIEGTPLEQGPPEPKGFDKYRIMAEDFAHKYLWYTVGGTFVVGFVLGNLLSGGKKTTAPTKLKKN